ncbi:MAG: 30S ribosomal protein S9 [Candidatus Vogelbacteria bacterium]|nr:30S ribosomal protein S9 [Candidatus Vogelbacteria bacterium]
MSKDRYYEAVGRRKTSTARVRLTQATKKTFVINERPLETYFMTEELKQVAKRPLAAAGLTGKISISAKIAGGGIHSQAEALSHGIARALLLLDPALRLPIKKLGYLTRDSRMKERRKFGLKKARKSPQWSKR